MAYNVMQVIGIAKTITGTTPNLYGALTDCYDGNLATYAWWRGSSEGGGTSVTAFFQVVFTNPIPVTKILVKWDARNREGGSSSSTRTVKVDGSTIITSTTVPYPVPETLQDTTFRSSVTTVRVDMTASCGDGQPYPRESDIILYELEVWTPLQVSNTIWIV